MKKILVVVILVVILVPGALALVGLAAGRTKVRTHAVAGPVREIVVKSDSGDVDLVAAGARVQVRETRHYVFKQPTLEQDLTDGVLTLEGDCKGFFFNCSTDLRIAVPAGVEVTVEADSGDVDARAIRVPGIHARSDSGDMTLELAGHQSLVWAHSDSGDVRVASAGARAVDAAADSGDISVRAATARAVQARTDSGDVHVEARGDPRRIVARTDSGDIEVTVPAGEYAIDTDTDSGDVDVDDRISRDDRAPRSIQAQTDSGDVRIRGG
jgi:hypothetical protein